ncbi:MAG: hypothetical protein IJ491_03275 [Clostridia bacterium]|nr:hypothetical protein [Clostridia bacterium]
MFFLQLSVIGNITVVAVKFAASLILPSLWFFINACFMLVLTLSRLFAIRDYTRTKKIKDSAERQKTGYRNYRNNGIILIFLGLVYFCVSLYMLFRTSRISMHEYMTYLTALIAFWSIGSAIYGLTKYKRNHTPIIKAVKITNLANALASIVLTQVVLLNNFAQGVSNLNIANGLTGMLVSIVIFSLGIYMIVGIIKHQKNEL